MEPYSETITANNLGDRPAKITYVIQEIKIFGKKVEPPEGDRDYTSAELKALLESDEYPFNITISIPEDEEIMVPLVGKATVTVSLTWDFESENDEVDTMWGQLSYKYEGDEPAISIKIELKATQVQTTD